jgi:hypothetical protein
MPQSALLLALVTTLSAAAPPGRGDNQPGWPGLFSLRPMYDLTFQKPVVGPGEKPDTYRQTATYMWLGGRYEEVDVTLARDPAFPDRYSPAALAKEGHPPQAREVNGKKAWLWEFPHQPGDIRQVSRRLVVLLDTDKAMILELRGHGSDLEGVAREFDFAKVEQALAAPPKR